MKWKQFLLSKFLGIQLRVEKITVSGWASPPWLRLHYIANAWPQKLASEGWNGREQSRTSSSLVLPPSSCQRFAPFLLRLNSLLQCDLQQQKLLDCGGSQQKLFHLCKFISKLKVLKNSLASWMRRQQPNKEQNTKCLNQKFCFETPFFVVEYKHVGIKLFLQALEERWEVKERKMKLYIYIFFYFQINWKILYLHMPQLHKSSFCLKVKQESINRWNIWFCSLNRVNLNIVTEKSCI